jgi:hypothetical protein
MVVPFHWPDEVEIAGVRRSAAGCWWRFSGGYILIGEKIKERNRVFFFTYGWQWWVILSDESVFLVDGNVFCDRHGPYL